MTVRLQTFEGGALGSTPTITDTIPQFCTKFDQITVGAGSTFTYDSQYSAHGNMSLKAVPADSKPDIVKWLVESHTDGAACFYLFLQALPTSADGRLIYLATGTASTLVLRTISTGQLRMAGSGTALATTTNPLPIGTWLRVEVYYTVNTTNAAQGSARFAIYEGESTTAIYDSGLKVANLGTTTFDTCQIGILSTATPAFPTFWLDTIRHSTDAAAFLGPYPGDPIANQPPSVVVNSSNSVLAFGDSATLTGTVTDPEGEATTYSWNTTAGKLSGSGLTKTLTNDGVDLDTTAVITLTAVDNIGNVSNQSISVLLKKSDVSSWFVQGNPTAPAVLWLMQ